MNPQPPKAAFNADGIVVPLDQILPIRQFKGTEKNINRFQSILSSIPVVGLLQPLMVYPQKGRKDAYLLLDGHLRFHALKDLGHTEALCLIATDDESFTYNHRVNRLAPIQEHAMIMKAVKNGVSPKRIAEALHIDLAAIRARMNLLNGVHKEVVDMLKAKQMAHSVFQIFKKVKPLRQIEMAELMISANNFSRAYAEALFTGTLKEHLVNPHEAKKAKNLSADEITRMEREMELSQRELKAIETTYGETVLNLSIACAYLRSLLGNAKITRFLSNNHNDFLDGFRRIVSADHV